MRRGLFSSPKGESGFVVWSQGGGSGNSSGPRERSGVFLVTRGCSGHVSGPKGEERPFLVSRNKGYVL